MPMSGANMKAVSISEYLVWSSRIVVVQQAQYPTPERGIACERRLRA